MVARGNPGNMEHLEFRRHVHVFAEASFISDKDDGYTCIHKVLTPNEKHADQFWTE